MFCIPERQKAAISGPFVSAGPKFDLRRFDVAFCRPGSDLLSRVLRRSTIGAGEFHGRVRDGIGCISPRHDHQAGEGQELGSLCGRAER